jgi:hypothetical protein
LRGGLEQANGWQPMFWQACEGDWASLVGCV